jgi:hypothetical protein
MSNNSGVLSIGIGILIIFLSIWFSSVIGNANEFLLIVIGAILILWGLFLLRNRIWEKGVDALQGISYILDPDNPRKKQ